MGRHEADRTAPNQLFDHRPCSKTSVIGISSGKYLIQQEEDVIVPRQSEYPFQTLHFGLETRFPLQERILDSNRAAELQWRDLKSASAHRGSRKCQDRVQAYRTKQS